MYATILYCGNLKAAGFVGVLDKALKKGSFQSIIAITTPSGSSLLAGEVEELIVIIEEYSPHNTWWALSLAPHEAAEGVREEQTGMTNSDTVEALRASTGPDTSLLALIPDCFRHLFSTP